MRKTHDFRNMTQANVTNGAAVSALAGKVSVQSWACGEDLWDPIFPIGRVIFLMAGHVKIFHQTRSGLWHLSYRIAITRRHVALPVFLAREERVRTRCIAETNATAVVVRELDVDRLIVASQTFRKFVFQAYGNRVIGLMDDLTKQFERLRPQHAPLVP